MNTSYSLDYSEVNELALKLANEPTTAQRVKQFREPPDVSWAASQFLARVVRRASPVHARLDREHAEQVLSEIPNAPSLASLEQKSWVRAVLGRLEIPSGIAFSLRHEGENVLSLDERAALKALYAARYRKGPPFWIPRSAFDPIHAAHRASHPATPEIDDLALDGVIAPSDRDGIPGFLLPLHRSTESKPWQRLGSGVAAALWIILLHEVDIPSDAERLTIWIQFIEHIHDVVDGLPEMDEESVERFLTVALELVLAEPDLQEPSREIERLRWESELCSRGQWSFPSPQGPGSSMLDRWRWWSTVDDSIIRERCRATIDVLIAAIVHFDGIRPLARRRCERIMTLLRASDERPHLAWQVGLLLSLSRLDPIAWLVTEADLAPFAMAILLNRAMPETIGSRRLDFDSRAAATEAQRSDFWTSALQVAVFATADEDEQRFLAFADILLVLATSVYGPSRRRPASRAEHDARQRATLEIVSGRRDLVHDRALRVMRSRVELAARAARDRRPQFESLPLVALSVLFFLVELAEADGGKVTPELDETIVELYAWELERLTDGAERDSEPVHWVDLSSGVADFRWDLLVSRFAGTPRFSRVLRPVDFAALARSAKSTARTIRREPAEAAKLVEPLTSAAIRKGRTHLALLCTAHRALSDRRMASVTPLSALEETILWVVESTVAGDAGLDIPPLFADDVAHRFDGDDRPLLAPKLVDTLNRFAGERRDRAFDRWIALETLPTILLIILARAVPAAARERAQQRLQSLDFEKILGRGLWLPHLEQMIDAALEARDGSLAKRLLRLGDARVTGRNRSEWDDWAFSKRLLVAYLDKDEAAVEAVPAPPDMAGQYADAISPEQVRDFYRALLLLDKAPEQAREIFDVALRSRPKLVSHAVNRLVADVGAAAKIEDTAIRDERIEEALRLWSEFAAQARKESLESVSESVALSHLSAFDQLRRDVDFDRTWEALDTPLQRKLQFVSLAVTNSRRRDMHARAGQLLATARPFHMAPDGKPTSDFVLLEDRRLPLRSNDGAPLMIATRGSEEVARLRSQYREEISNLAPRDLVRVVSGGEPDRFFLEALLLALEEMLGRAFILRTPKEDHYNDLIVSLLRMHLRLLGWDVRDQSRGGESVGGKDAGRRDWMVTSNKGMTLVLFEALCLDSVKSTKISEHVDKLAKRYDPLGLPHGFIIVYANVDDQGAFWKNYCEYVGGLAIPGFEPTFSPGPDFCAELPRHLRVQRFTYAKDGLPYAMYHVVAFVPSTPEVNTTTSSA